MSGPKHLWSGDWERESAATSGAEADRRQDHEDLTIGEHAARTPAPTPETSAGTERRNGRIALATTLVILVIAVIVIVATNSGSDSQQPTGAAAIPSSPTNPGLTSPTPTTPNPTTPTPATPPTTTSSTTTAPTVAPRPVSWLGMEILTVPSGAAVIDAVTPGGAGDRAGLTPGDTIVEVDSHQITGSASIARAASGRHKGEMVTVTVVRGGTTLDVQTRFTGPPTAYP